MESAPPDDPGGGEEERLLREAARGDQEALRRLLEGHRGRLRRMVALRLDSRLAARVDASDVVQEAMLDAARKLADYERERPLPLYPWLHRLAAERLAAAHRKHLCKNRSVDRERAECDCRDPSAALLVDQLVAGDTTPGHHMLREEQRQRVREALGQLAATDREVLVMRYLEDLTFPEIAAILGVSEGAAKMRHLRAIEKVRSLLKDDDSGPLR
ncbi:ECF RNA polymerase sigma factor SigD [Aquisphaera giovannonii]|uniref:ECF RNA polymerase sigma factor SigD n=1 Tax=Aquisphaera giovannonii TaxID=406548 RepID=A0A5B9W4N8_9BACT|nr:sigma-70 family RNA polymerase sigma factor [Aquisphaera giovannonii]QEH35189.1 ECF RNA polymerase sigma factor SigD [Aquisphaera giovannonii]